MAWTVIGTPWITSSPTPWLGAKTMAEYNSFSGAGTVGQLAYYNETTKNGVDIPSIDSNWEQFVNANYSRPTGSPLEDAYHDIDNTFPLGLWIHKIYNPLDVPRGWSYAAKNSLFPIGDEDLEIITHLQITTPPLYDNGEIGLMLSRGLATAPVSNQFVTTLVKETGSYRGVAFFVFEEGNLKYSITQDIGLETGRINIWLKLTKVGNTYTGYYTLVNPNPQTNIHWHG